MTGPAPSDIGDLDIGFGPVGGYDSTIGDFVIGGSPLGADCLCDMGLSYAEPGDPWFSIL